MQVVSNTDKCANRRAGPLPALLGAAALVVAALAGPAAAQSPGTAAGFSLRVFATAPQGMSAPDSIAVVAGNVWIAYGNGTPPNGTGGPSNVIEYSLAGSVLRTLTIAGHNDGLRYDPMRRVLFALQNEDGNATLVAINPSSGAQTAPQPIASVNGGGFDDAAFVGPAVFVSASAPALNGAGINTHPALVRLGGTRAGGLTTTPVLAGNATAIDVVTGLPVTLNLTDPDSLITTPAGDLLLDSQADAELVMVRVRPGSGPRVIRIPLNGVQVDDTVFATGATGVLFIADRNANTVYAVRSKRFAAGEPYSATSAYVGQLSLTTGALTPIVTGLVSAHGMAFLKLHG